MVESIDLSDGQTFRHGFPHEFFRWLRDEKPLYWHPPTSVTPDGEGFWVLSRHQDIATTIRDHQGFSSARGGTREHGGTAIKDERSAGDMLNQSDNPHHRRLRELVQKGFTTRAIAKLEDELRNRTRRLLDDIAEQDAFDCVRELARELPLQAICIILGVPQSDRTELARLVDAGIENNTGDVIGHDMLRALGRYAETLIEEKRQRPTDDILSTIVHAEIQGYDEPKLSNRELRLFFNLLFPAGAETTRSAIAGGVKAFMDFPDQLARLRADPSLVSTAVEEIVRWTTPSIYKRRTATADVVIHDQLIRAGDKVTYWEMSANRDEREFCEPFRFDISRSPNRHLGFGAGIHFCLGSQLARLEIRVVLDELYRRYENFELAGEPLWMPSNRLLGLKQLDLRGKRLGESAQRKLAIPGLTSTDSVCE
ncbi:MAG: cytochrome P450 [Pseudomonadota bacterium]